MVRQSRAQPPPRPHSADFLEYEAARRPLQQPTQCERPPDQQRRPQRPKSSLDIVNPSDTTNDGYFYSEERYECVNSSGFKLRIYREKENENRSLRKIFTLCSRLCLDTRRRCDSPRYICTRPLNTINSRGISPSRVSQCSRSCRVSVIKPMKIEYPHCRILLALL